MKKQLANVITGVRIFGSAILLLFPAFSLGFCITYLICGLSDMIDGAIARKMNSVSRFGSKLDTVADMVFMAACVVKLLPMIHLAFWLWIWIVVIATIKVTNMVLEFVYRRKLVDYHTVLNKSTGLLLFLVPFTLSLIEPAYSLSLVCVVATVAAVQETYYIVKNKEV